ncbi:MAG: acyltransferase [Solobacterium sp.]|nr:acyltransferase [Solobacterium sp.]
MQKKRIYGLDFLRTFALLGVLLYHAFPRTIQGGYFGVVIFFVISGFLSAYHSANNPNEKLFVYYKNRFLRIYPALILVLFISIAIIAHVDMFRLTSVQEEVVSVLLGYNNYWQLSKQADYFANLANTSAFTHLWYIAILIQFDLVWPIVFKLYQLTRKNLKLFGLFVFMSLLVLPVKAIFTETTTTQLYYGTDTRIHALLLGAYLGLWYHKLQNRKRTISFKTPFALLLLISFLVLSTVVFLFVPGTALGVYRYGLVLYALFVGVILFVLIHTNPRFTKRLDIGLCQWFSKYSYEIYLWQYPIFFIAKIARESSSVLYYVLQIIVIILLSVWTNAFVRFILPNKKQSVKRRNRSPR